MWDLARQDGLRKIYPFFFYIASEEREEKVTIINTAAAMLGKKKKKRYLVRWLHAEPGEGKLCVQRSQKSSAEEVTEERV